MKKAGIYARYSSERQTEQSIEGQIRDCRSFAEAEGIAEKAYRLYQKERQENPELQAARKALKNVTQRLDNAVEAVLSGLSSNAVRNAISDLESRKTDQDKQHIIDTIVNRVIVYPERIVILINVTDTTKTPPLQQITAALEGSCNIVIG